MRQIFSIVDYVLIYIYMYGEGDYHVPFTTAIQTIYIHTLIHQYTHRGPCAYRCVWGRRLSRSLHDGHSNYYRRPRCKYTRKYGNEAIELGYVNVYIMCACVYVCMYVYTHIHGNDALGLGYVYACMCVYIYIYKMPTSPNIRR